MVRRGEFDLIADLFAPLATGFGGALKLKDDAALLDVPAGQTLVATTDTMVAGVHFFPDDPPELIARKLVRVNLSDIAAMGAKPWVVLLNTCLPRDIDESWLESFASGLAVDCAEFGLHVVGGDTVATSGPIVLTLTAFGLVERGRALLRSGAVVGDLVYVSGTIGDGALGLLAAQGTLAGTDTRETSTLLDRYRLPRPRVHLGSALAGLASACMDISDGLHQDLGHICRASGVGALIDAARVPLSDAAQAALRATPEYLERVLGGGDDYELLFTVPPALADRVAAVAATTQDRVTAIGLIVAGGVVQVKDDNGMELRPVRRGYQHFGGQA
ncbi:MAG: thiamine-phosphate kinase [Alphaproteobacteria bacterium]|nr:thiamine-phosphate kinase [Alphaproteobacteria bacterium]